MQVDISLSSEDLTRLSQLVAQALFENMSKASPAALRKHVYTVTEVAQQINNTAITVRRFIREGRKDRTGRVRKLPAHKITTGDLRVRPADLDQWISYF